MENKIVIGRARISKRESKPELTGMLKMIRLWTKYYLANNPNATEDDVRRYFGVVGLGDDPIFQEHYPLIYFMTKDHTKTTL